MDILEYRDYCLSLPFVEESTPFDETTLVFKVGGRMFTYAGMEDFRRLAVKCDPDEAVGLRERYEGCLLYTSPRGSRRRGTATNATGTTSMSTAI